MLQDRTILTSSMNITNGCIFENVVAPLFQHQYVQSPQPVPSTKVQLSSMISNTVLMTYQLIVVLYTGP